LPQGKTPLPHSKAFLPHGKTLLPQGKTPLPHGKAPLPHGKTLLPQGKTPLPHGKALLPQGETLLPEYPRTTFEPEFQRFDPNLVISGVSGARFPVDSGVLQRDCKPAALSLLQVCNL